ncbi:sugar phosphate nucleotidyltransferase [Pelagibacteraceae bacterium]|nr:sugar phosphate nucleotidyltransferase [Pelagibacteraceae bacterium]
MKKINKLVILAGGLGTRLMEETAVVPKPMVLIDKYPLIVHIMKFYQYYGVDEVYICGGYKIEKIIEYFLNLNFNSTNLVINFKNIKIKKFF